jgi:hypothetical protein
LTYSNDFIEEHVEFLEDNGLTKEDIAKVVVSHPQVQASEQTVCVAVAVSGPWFSD